MIDELIVRNLGLIEAAHLHPGPGLTVITGETGTGKTLLLGALRMLLGESTNSDLVGPFGSESTVEGRFVAADGTEVGASRRVPREGRSRAYLNGAVASAVALDAATAGLVEIIGQHDQLTLTRAAEARRLVDQALDSAGRVAESRYQQAWKRLQDARSRQERLGGDRRVLERERDLADHQSSEITDAGFSSGDDRELEQLVGRLRNAAEIGEHLASAQRGIESARDAFDEAVGSVARAQRLDSTLSNFSEALAAIEQAMGEAAIDIGDEIEGVDTDPSSLDQAEARFGLLGDLKRKYGSTLEEVLAFGAEMTERSSSLTELLDSADVIAQEISDTERAVATAGSTLSESRRRAGDALVQAATGHLIELGFRDPTLEVLLEQSDPGPLGSDRVSLQFAADRRLTVGDLTKVASGGELSRLVLALRLAGGSGTTETLVFDEIDTGIGGATAIEIGKKLAALSKAHQVLCVTHLPQVAAFADAHYVVSRAGDAATVELVSDEQRIEELSRMLAGVADSANIKRTAADLLDIATHR